MLYCVKPGMLCACLSAAHLMTKLPCLSGVAVSTLLPSLGADAAGQDWVGSDAAGKPWVCTTGQQQSPVNLPVESVAAVAVANEHITTFDLGVLASNGSNVAVANNGHSVQVSWPQQQPGFSPTVSVSIQGERQLTA